MNMIESHQPNHRRSLALFGAAVLFLTQGACGDPRDGGTDAGSGEPAGGDAGTPQETLPAPPPGAVALAAQGAVWVDAPDVGSRWHLVLGIELANGQGGAPASLAPALFHVATRSGLEVLGVDALAAQGEACSADLAVAGGSRRACAVAFRVPEGEEPVRVIYRDGTGREAVADIPACSAATPTGLCERGLLCLFGVCDVPCGEEAPDGACPDGMLCERGTCEPTCSAEVPDGACAEGVCVDGACGGSCVAIDIDRPGCTDCLIGLSGDVCGLYDPAPCADATLCMTACSHGEDSCRCTENSACEGCEAQARTVMDCIAAFCPVCAG